MTDWSKFLENLLPGIITGAGSAVTTVYTFVQGLRKQVTELEVKVAALDTALKALDGRVGVYDPVSGSRSGLFKGLSDLSGTVVTIDARVGHFDSNTGARTGMLGVLDALSDKLEREANQAQRGSIDTQAIEERIERRVQVRLDLLERRLAELTEIVNQCVTYENYEVTSQRRAEELVKIRESVASLAGMLSVVKGYLDPTPAPKKGVPR